MDLLKFLRHQVLSPFAPRRRGWSLFPVVAAVFCCAIGAAPANQPGDYEVKAAFLFNFAKFVEWPGSSFDDPQAPVVFGIIGGGELAFQLQRIAAGGKVQGRDVLVRKEGLSDDARHCQILFIGASEHEHSAQILAGLQDASVLTVSDIDGFAESGGMVQVIAAGGQARFIVNLDAVTQGKLRVSAKLLALARVINHGEAARRN